MEATDIRLSLATLPSATKAFGSFSLDGAFVIKGIRVVEDKNGKLFVAYPSRAKEGGEYEDIAFPLSKELYHKIEDAVVAEYQRTLTKEQSQTENAAIEQDQVAKETTGKRAKSR